MKTHSLQWFEARVGQTIYPTFSDRTRKERPSVQKMENSGILIQSAKQAEILFNNQVDVGTRYSEERVVA